MNYLIRICVVLFSITALAGGEFKELIQQFLKAKEPYVIAHIIVDAQSQQPCIIENWNHVARYACRCCLVKAFEQQEDSKKILETCKHSGICSDDLITQLRTDEGLTGADDNTFLRTLYDRSKIIKEVSVEYDSGLSKTGTFTKNNLATFLQQAYQQKKLIDPVFSQAQCLSVKDIGATGGAMTKQLFVVKNTCSAEPTDYIIKEMAKKKTEAIELTFVSHYKPLEPYIAPHHVAQFPVIVLPTAYLHYNANGDHYIAIMPKASGVEFADLMKNYAISPTETNKNTLIQAYKTLGTTLANIHKKFMGSVMGKLSASDNQPEKTVSLQNQNTLLGTTIVQGDLHGHNVFYDAIKDRIFWIDNEKMGLSTIDPQAINVDIAMIIAFPFITNFFAPSTTQVDKKKWASTFYKPFLTAYLTAFDGNVYERAKEMKTIIGNPSGHPGVNFTPIVSWVTDAVYPVIDQIIKEYKP